MKLLNIDNKQGHFLDIEGQYQPIDKITKDELLNLVQRVLNKKDIEFDEYDEEKIANPAHQIIYKSVYDNLKDLFESKDEFLDESETLFYEAYERYKQDGEAEPEA